MNRRTLLVTVGWIALNLLSAAPLLAEVPEHTEQTTPANAEATSPGSGERPKLEETALPIQYEDLIKALAKVDSKGLKVVEQKTIKGETTEVTIKKDEAVALKKWVENFKSYRETMMKCGANDRSAKAFALYLDKYVAELLRVVTDDPSKAKGSDEKALVTMTAQMERFLDEKKKEFASDVKDFEAIDVKLREQLVKTAKLFFGEYRKLDFQEDAARKEKITVKEGTPPVDVEKFPYLASVTEMDDAVKALKARAANLEKTCKLTAETASTSTTPEKPQTDKDKDKPEGDKTKTDTELSSKVEPPKLDGKDAPPSGGNDNTEGPTASPSPSPSPSTPPGGEGGGAGGGEGGGAGAGGGVPGIDPVGGAANVFDPNQFAAQLQPFLDNLRNDIARQGQLQADDLQNRLRAGEQALNDLARLQNLEQDQNKDALADALRNVGNRQGDRSNTEVPPQPIQPPNISPDLSRGNQAPPPVPPNEPEPQLPPQIPFMPPPQMAQNPIVIPQENRPWQEERRRGYAPVPVQNNSGIMDLLRMTQMQLQQAQMAAAQRNQLGTTAVNGGMRGRLMSGPRRTNALGRGPGGTLTRSRTGSRTGARTTPSLRRGPQAQLSLSPRSRTGGLPSAVESRSSLSR